MTERDVTALPLYDAPATGSPVVGGGDRMDEPTCSPLCGASKAYGRFDQPWKHEPECPVRIAWEAERSRLPSYDVTDLVRFDERPDGSVEITPW